MVELLKQGQYVPMSVEHQVMIIWCGSEGHLDAVEVEDMSRFESEFLAFCDKKYPDIAHTLTDEKKISDEIAKRLTAAVEEFSKDFKAA